MMTIGNFIGEVFPDGDTSDLDFFPWPEMNPEFGTETIEAPIDGWMMAASPKNPEAAKELLYHFGTADAQEAYLKVNPSIIGAATDIDQSIFSPLQIKALEAVTAASSVTQFLDRDTSPEFASNVAGQAFADFLSDPSSIDGVLEDMQAQAEVIFAE
jgi:multiple sugar transport system substrate-binding protein